jgi:HAD superfamily hydrolase (TIGR01509 family)
MTGAALFPATPAEEELVFTLPGSQLFGGLVDDDPVRTAALVAAFQLAYERHGAQVRPFPAVARMLRELRAAGVAVAVVTSKARRRYTADAAHAGLDWLIDVAVCAQETAAHKPDPAPVRHALAALGVPAADAVMCGDTPVDVAAGLAAGTAVVGVAWGMGTAELLEQAGATAVAHDPRELTRLVLDPDQRRRHGRVTAL